MDKKLEVGGFTEKGEKILKIIENKNCTIVFVEQDNLEENLDGYYEVLASLLLKNQYDELKKP